MNKFRLLRLVMFIVGGAVLCCVSVSNARSGDSKVTGNGKFAVIVADSANGPEKTAAEIGKPDWRFYNYAKHLWLRAEREQDRYLVTKSWETAAEAFDRVVVAGKLPAKEIKEATSASVLARKLALLVSVRSIAGNDALPIPGGELEMVAAFERYLETVTKPVDPERVMVHFIQARIYWNFGHFEKAVTILEGIVEHHRSHETAEKAVYLLLDSLKLKKKFKRILHWVDELRADKDFLQDRKELSDLLNLLKYQIEGNQGSLSVIHEK